MADAVVTKTPTAQFDYDMEFSDLIPSGSAIVNKSVTATDSAAADATATVIASSSITGTKVRAHFQAGSDLEDYLVLFHALTTGDAYGRTLELRVRTDPISGFNKG